jgi:hypothetical protein
VPDLEKLLARIFTYSIKHSVEAIYFEDVSLIKMREFRQLLNSFREVDEILDGLKRIRDTFTSTRLKMLLSTDIEGGMLPSNLNEALDEFSSLIVWKVV